MKKGFLSFVLTVISVMAFAQLQTAPEWTSILSNKPDTFQKQLVSSTENSIKVNVQVPGFYTTEVRTPNGVAKVITMPKALSTAQAGEPDVPMTGIPVMIGDKARMNVRVLDAQYMDFEGIEVAPSKGDFPRTIDPETVPYTYGECYSKDAFFPAKNLGMYEPYIIRDFRGQNMAVYPFAYNPVTKTLRVYYNMTVEMFKVDDKGENVIESRRSNVVKMDQDFKSMYQRHFINFEEGMAKYTPLEEQGDLLIICYDNFISNMTDFVNWKKTRGINTTIVGTSTISSSLTYSNLKTYIQNQYNANNNLTHVLLVGDVAQIPGYSYSGGGSDYSGLGDNNYGQIVGSDIYNDVIIGRFSASTAARVTTQCQRAITYERDLTTSASWLQKGEGISRKENGSGHNSEDDYQHMDNIRTDLLNYGYTTVNQRYANLTGYDGSSSTISSDLNSGVGIVNYANHGQETAWGANSSGYIYYANSHVNALTNDNKLPFIFSVACLVGKYDHSSDCFAEAWMNATNSSTSQPTGAIGTLMSYISQPWIPPMWAQDECIDILVESYTNNKKYSYGGICINGLMGIFDHYSTSEQSAVGTYQAWIVYGDPTLMVRTKTPQTMTVTHTGTLPLGNSSYNVTVSNGNGAVATITDASHNILGKATVSNGSANINISGSSSLTANQELTLCVFGYNKVTYLGTITVTGGTKYNITASANPTAGGSVSGAGEYYENTSCTLTATANAHYEFSRWTKNGSQVSTANPYTFTVNGDASYVAQFTALSPHTVTCNATQNGTISASPTTAYKGETVTLTATPASGYYMGEWTVKDASNNNITVTNNQFTMPDSNVTVSATFVVGYNVTLASVMNGTISANPTAGPSGTQVTLTATPASGYVFDSWLVYNSNDVTQTVTVSNNKFTMPAYDVTVVGFFGAQAGGDVTVGSGTSTTNGNYLPTYVYYNYCLSQQIYTPSEINSSGTITDISFYWNGKSTSSSGSASSSGARNLKIYMSHTNNANLTNSWIQESNSHLVYSGTQTFNAIGWYTITLDTPFQYDGTSNLVLTVDDNTGSYTVNAKHYFRTYSTGENRARVICNDDTNPDPLGTVSTTISSSDPYNLLLTYNSQIKFSITAAASSAALSASPTSLQEFTYPEGNGPSAYQTVALVGANLESNVTVSAPTDYEVCLTENGTYASSLSIAPTSGNVQKMVYVRLKAGLAQGNYNNESLTFTSGSVSQTVTLSGTVSQGDGTYYTITVAAEPEVGGTVTGGNTYKEGTTATLTATANAGYTFQNWTLNGNVVSTNATYSFEVNAAGNYIANFTRNSYTIMASANPAEGGTVTGAGNYYEGTPVELIATANEGYAFVNWTKNNEIVSTEPTFTFNVTAGGAYVAHFKELESYSITVNQASNGTISADKETAYPGDIVTLTENANNGYYFSGWEVLTANNQVVEVSNDNTFVMPESNVTVTASFAQGFVITLANTANGTVTADKENALPGETITLTVTPDTDYFLSALLVLQSGDVDNSVTVTNNQFTMPSYDVTVFAIFKANEVEEVTVGSGTSTNNYIPTYAYYKYSLTQQIYTASEIGSAGSITAIAFKVSNSQSTSRTLDVYMKATTATAFTSTSGWTTCSSSDKVFSGSVTFAASGWTTITFNTPFEYDGESNVIVCVDDNTGSYVSQSSSPQFYVYSTNANRTLRYYNDYTNLNPTSSISTTGTYVTSNNQITFTVSHPSSGATLSVSPNSISNFSYEVGDGPSRRKTLDIIGVDVTEDIVVTAPNDYEIADAADGTYGSTVTISASSKGNRETVTYDFEDGWQGWTTFQGTTSSSHSWMHNTEYTAYDSNGDLIVPECHDSSSGMMLSESYISASTSGGSGTAVTPDNYLVSPQIELGGSFSFYAASRMSNYPAEKFTVYVSQTGNTSASNFTTDLLTVTLSDNSWQQYTVNLSAYSGQGYVAIRHYDCTDQHLLYIDDVTVVGPSEDPGTTALLTANVYVRMMAGLAEGSYDGTLTVATGEVTSNVNLSGQVTENTSGGNTVTQTVVLSSGSNWWTPYVELTLEQLEAALGDNGLIISAQDGSSVTYDETFGWGGDLTEIEVGKMYIIKTKNNCTFDIEGTPINPDDYTITLTHGKNWIGFFGSQATEINTALANLNATADDVITSQDGLSASYDATFGWGGDLTTLEPGQAYIYTSNAAGTVTFKFASAKGGDTELAKEDDFYWSDFNYHDFNYHMDIRGKAFFDGVLQDNRRNIEIAAFVDGELRGTKYLVEAYPSALPGVYFIWNACYYDVLGETFTFKAYDHDNNVEYDLCDVELIGTEAAQGTPSNPIEFYFTKSPSFGPDYPWTPSTAYSGDGMLVLAQIKIDGELVTRETYEVGAFCGDECRANSNGGEGSNLDDWTDLDLGYFAWLTIMGNDGDVINFYLYDKESNSVVHAECPTTIELINDGELGLDPENGDLFVLNFITTPFFTKDIAGYNGDGGWYLIASPIGDVDPADVENMKANGFDLYRFNQSAELEWENYKEHDGNAAPGFSLESGRGYLYANSEDVTLIFKGNPYDGDGEVTLHYDGNADFKGWNLVGNPFAQSATVDKPFYIINNNTNEGRAEVIASEASSVEAMEGVFVVAEQEGETVTFTPTQDPGKASEQLIVNLSGNHRGGAIDRAIVRFDDSRALPKFQLFEGNAKLYIPQNGKDYAVVNADNEGEMPLCFKAAENGTYTLSFRTEGINMGYLHLIDNMTGNDVDLLATPSYSFDARITDYASRFRLVFSAQDNSNDHFAFISNGQIILTGVDANATIQVIDALGRVIITRTVGGQSISTKGTTAGVYVLRLIEGNETRTQKIVIR